MSRRSGGWLARLGTTVATRRTLERGDQLRGLSVTRVVCDLDREGVQVGRSDVANRGHGCATEEQSDG